MGEGLEVDAISDFECLCSFLPDGWQDKARELHALRRTRKFPNASALLQVLLIHLVNGRSLRETAVLAREGGIVDVSDVAIMDRLKQSKDWFHWMCQGLMSRWIDQLSKSVFESRWNVRVVDGTRVKEPGPTGSSWLVNYSIGLPSLSCDEVLVTAGRGEGQGESFKRFDVSPGDLLIGDRAYGVRSSILHVCQRKGDVLVRFAADNLPLLEQNMRPFNLLKKLRGLRGTQVGDWPVCFQQDGEVVQGRVCAIKKSRQATEKAQDAVRRQAQKHGFSAIKKETLEMAGYIFIFTTISQELLSASAVLEMYRGRWQIELVFKRLKGTIALGHLRKYDKDAARAWIHGKLLVAFLMEALLRQGEAFSPWGYPLRTT